METKNQDHAKRHKFRNPPSVSGLILTIIQSINFLKENPPPSKCYSCNQEKSVADFRKVNREFDQYSPDKFAFIIENLGLSGLSVAPEFFTDGSVNICSACLRPIEHEYEALLIVQSSERE